MDDTASTAMPTTRVPRAGILSACVLTVWILAGRCPIATAAEPTAVDAVRRANDAYRAGKYREALDGYHAAAVTLPETPELAFNEGVAYYKLGEFAKAREALARARATRDLALETRTTFNLGNCAYAEALQKTGDLSEAIDLARSAIAHYRDVIDADPNDADARANIETASLFIKDLLDRQKQQQEQQKQNQQQNQDQQKQQDDQPQNGKRQDQQEQDESRESSGQQQQEGQQDQDSAKDEQQQQQSAGASAEQQDQAQPPDRKEPGQARQARTLTPEEAERLLQAVRDKEHRRRLERRRHRNARRAPVRRDW